MVVNEVLGMVHEQSAAVKYQSMCENTDKEHENLEIVQLATWPKALHDKQTNLPQCPKCLMTAGMFDVFLVFFLLMSTTRLTEPVLIIELAA
jgi:hypothetical protein